jgi:methionine-rich copper-binding protein CopC
MCKLTAPALLVSVGLALIAAGTSAQAHALLDHASPGVGSSIATAPPVLSLSFTQELEPAFTNVTVTNEAGQRVDLGNTQVPPGTPTELRVGLPPLPPGTYTVSWRVVSVDTHPTEGHFQFTIGR